MPPPVIPPCPPPLKPIQHFLKVAADHDTRDPVVSYWCRMHALQTGLKLDRKAPESVAVHTVLLDWLETEKRGHKDNEMMTNETAGQAHLENYAIKLFMWADSQDRAAKFDKNVVKAFYTSGVIYDVCHLFGELTEEAAKHQKYAKWKAAYIHNCLKNGEDPIPGPMDGDEDFADPIIPIQPNAGQNNVGDRASEDNSDVSELQTFASGLPAAAHGYNATLVKPELPAEDFSSTVLKGAVHIGVEEINKAQKYCKFASSALNYEDVPTALLNLKKAVTLLETGHDPQ